MKVQLIDSMWNDTTPIKRARVSFNWDGKTFTEEKDNNLLNRLMSEKHYWVLEWNAFTFMIECDIPTARQIMRHRTFSYNELSRRYLDNEHTSFNFEIPEIRWNKNKPFDDNNKKLQLSSEIQNFYKKWLEVYELLIGEWVAKEVARYVIPQWMITRFYMTWNLRNWLHFLELRTNEHSQLEVRNVANEIQKQIKNEIPKIMNAYFDNL